jgi:hypothetical protein
VAQVSTDGTVTITGKEGSAKITVLVDDNGHTVSDEIWISVTAGKSEPTLYTYEERAIAQENVLKYDWAWEEKEKASAEEQAKRFVEGLYLEYRFSQLNGEGDYYAENSILWFSKTDGTYEPCGYELTDAGLTITEVENPRVYRQLKLELPLLLTKAQ